MKFRYLVVIVIALLILTEVFLRAFISQPSSQQYDSELGYTNIPGAKMVESLEGYSHVTFNQLGFNDAEPQKELIRKIFIIGDSYTEAFQLDVSLGYTSLLENALAPSGIDIIKLARDSFLPLHYPVVSDRYFDMYEPELTILQLGSHTLGGLYGENISITYSADNEIQSYALHVSDNDRKKEKFRMIINNSALIYHLMRRYKPLIVKAMSRFNHLFATKPVRAKGRAINLEMSDEDSKKRLSYILKKLKGRVVVIYIPDPAVIFNITEHNDNVRNVISSASKSADRDFIDFTDIFTRDFSINNQFLNGFQNSKPNGGHLNQYGHQVVAKNLVIELKKAGYLKTL
ncbi:hypothetical protein MNBD_GAMMA09-221 [hydrothermal vent metagenome]|uniref:SGNH hydrolase-type esterase domain-containing protein n=1 Tax=hydrothermal vent metagenome TaxID=652676 RepID=A0A3B0YC16_9ZZZZ